MKRFIISISCFFGIPFLSLLGIYLWTDPFRSLHAFDIENTDSTNREYLSTELYLQNRDSIHYDSFIFASSRGGGLNTYQWKQYLPTSAEPFLFQAWAETLTGEYLKIKFLYESGVEINNAIMLLDVPSSFSSKQLSHDALDIKHFIFTGGNRATYNCHQFLNFIQKPSFWIKSIKQRDQRAPYYADLITNDWNPNNRYDYTTLPTHDSLKLCSATTKQTLLSQVAGKTADSQIESPPLISQSMENMLVEIKDIFDKNQTNYAIVISPAICFTNPAINSVDLQKLTDIFGDKNVFNYSGVNRFTIDVNNYSDPGHFDRNVGFQLLTEIYNAAI